MMFLRLARLEAAREKEGGRRAALTSVLRRRYAERSPIVSTPSAALSTLAMPNASSAHWSTSGVAGNHERGPELPQGVGVRSFGRQRACVEDVCAVCFVKSN